MCSFESFSLVLISFIATQTIMDPLSSNGFQLENQPTPEPPTWELYTNPYQKKLFDEHSSQELETIPLENRPNGAVSTSNILRHIDQILMEDDDLELLQESSDFRAKEKSFYEALCQKNSPSPQHESPSLNPDEKITEKISHSDAMANNVPMQEFDDSVWMYTVDEKLAADMAKMQICLSQNLVQPSGPAKIRSKKRNKGPGKDEVVDLQALLIDCSKSVSSGNRLTSKDLLRQIRQHSSPHGDGIQRLAHYFADGLEARLAGTTHENITDTPEYLRQYRVFRSSSLLRKIMSFASNETIAIKSENATIIHIIDFGILYGIQWPSFIRIVAGREGGPPKKLRITGIEFPQAAEIIDDTGRRLAGYAEMFGVWFEYRAIAREWETIKIDDLKIEKDEFVAVVCSVRAMRLLDETVRVAGCPRVMVLELIREINPDIFVHMIINGAFNQPLFTYRFRDLLFHYSAVFNMVETLIPRERPERMMNERDLFGKDILNGIACEGPGRVERPETYRQWEVRHLKAGFMKVPFERKLVEAIMCKVKDSFHSEFSIFEENQWLTINWKGRALNAISCWQPDM